MVIEDTLLEVKNLVVSFKTDTDKKIEVVHGINFSVKKSEIISIVGESGSGKSVTGLSIMGLNPNAEVSGEIIFRGKDLLKYSEKDLQSIRGRKIAMIFQDPMTALNPFLKITEQIMDPLRVHKKMSKQQAKSRALELLNMVGIEDIDKNLRCYPHHLSGGMCQRVMIAMALSCEPELLIADEATTALDVIIQAQILDLIEELAHKLNMSVIIITHNLGIVAGLSKQVIVMNTGNIVEQGQVDEIFYRTKHPYTKGLLRSIPRLDQDRNQKLYSMHNESSEQGFSETQCNQNLSLEKKIHRGFFRQAYGKAYKNKMFTLGMGIFFVYLVIVAAAPILPIHDYTDQNIAHLNLPPSFRKVGYLIYEKEQKNLQLLSLREKRSLTSQEQQNLDSIKDKIENEPLYSRYYLLGTDSLGRDLLSRLVYASRISIFVGILGALVSILIGSCVGSIAGYFGGYVDRSIMSIVEILNSLPYILVVVILMTILGNNLINLFIGIALISWLVEARIVRGQILSLKKFEFIEAARSMGAGPYHIIFRHLIPNIFEIIIVLSTVRIPTFILAESFLSFLGLGVSAPLASWGTLVRDGLQSMELYPWQLFFPALVMGVFLFSVNFIGDGLRDFFDIKENS